MIAVNDVNRFARFMFANQSVRGTNGMEYTRDDVYPALWELKVMLERMFNRLKPDFSHA